MDTQMPNTAAAHSKLKLFFIEQLQDIYWAEKKLVKTLPKMQKAATSAQLKTALEDHLSQTKEHVSRLEHVFRLIGEEASAKKCLAMAGIADEGDEIVDETEEGTSQRDVGIIFAAQKAEHYEMATYGGLKTLAGTLGLTEVKNLLEQTLGEEKEADALLTQIAESGINYEAATEPQ